MIQEKTESYCIISVFHRLVSPLAALTHWPLLETFTLGFHNTTFLDFTTTPQPLLHQPLNIRGFSSSLIHWTDQEPTVRQAGAWVSQWIKSAALNPLLSGISHLTAQCRNVGAILYWVITKPQLHFQSINKFYRFYSQNFS